MSRLCTVVFGVLSLAFVGAHCGAAQGGASTGPAPDFSLRTTTGESFRLGDHLEREVIVLTFWTSFCPSCRTELTNFDGLYQELRDEGLLVVAVALDSPDTVSDVRTIAERLGFTFPVVLDEESTVAGLYNPRGATPFTVLIDREGRRVWSHEGFVAGDAEDIEARIRELLAEGSGEAGDASGGGGGAQ
ncbi:MAG: TlpA family protein disulfide reductase [Deltaproteobacteria bacterium]|nr:TlpA family protein disulfide reductase [Deltaproteobacteria bacterium]